jgi:hypothetical protein
MQTWSLDGVRQERTGWRCDAISLRHRQWGFNCPAVDLDFVMTEFNHGKPVALIEYKDRRAQEPNLQHSTYRALTALADGYKDGPLPFLVAFYCPDDWWFRVIPVNGPANNHWKHCVGIKLTEQRFVKGLYLLRKRELTKQDDLVIGKLNDRVPSNGPVSISDILRPIVAMAK